MDKDNSGRLSLDAFMQLMANKMAEKDTKEEIMKVLIWNAHQTFAATWIGIQTTNLLWFLTDLCSLGWMTMGVSDVKKGLFSLDNIYTDGKKEKGILLLIVKQPH